MRRRRSTEQRLWLGPGGYPCGGRRRPIAYAYADGDGNCNCYYDAASESVAYTYSDVNGAAYSNSQRYSAIQTSADTTSSALKMG